MWIDGKPLNQIATEVLEVKLENLEFWCDAYAFIHEELEYRKRRQGRGE